MMNGFFVSITNNLLEDKHFERMGNAVWLYMWLIDRMTDISEGQGIVNGGYPVTHAMVQQNFGTMNDRLYRRYIATLRDAGYINTMKAQYGLYITINKAKKNFGKKVSAPAVKTTPDKTILTEQKKAFRPDKKVLTEPTRPDKNGRAVRTKLSTRPDKNGTTLYIDNNTITTTSNNTIKGDKKSPRKNEHHELVSKLYYEAIKALDLPVRNHNNVKAKIAEMARDSGKEKIINYLTFLRDQYTDLDWDYKPHMSEALDIFNKRQQIRNTFEQHLKDSKRKKSETIGGEI